MWRAWFVVEVVDFDRFAQRNAKAQTIPVEKGLAHQGPDNSPPDSEMRLGVEVQTAQRDVIPLNYISRGVRKAWAAPK